MPARIGNDEFSALCQDVLRSWLLNDQAFFEPARVSNRILSIPIDHDAIDVMIVAYQQEWGRPSAILVHGTPWRVSEHVSLPKLGETTLV
jgi:hypothetical protein